MTNRSKKRIAVVKKKTAPASRTSNARKTRNGLVQQARLKQFRAKQSNPQQSRKEQPRTKQSAAIALLHAPGGATIDALMKLTGWQPHSVRGFLAGVVRKRLKLNLDSSLVDGRRFYRVTGGAGGANTTPASQPKS